MNTSRTCGEDNFGRSLESASISIEVLTEGSVMLLHNFWGRSQGSASPRLLIALPQLHGQASGWKLIDGGKSG